MTIRIVRIDDVVLVQMQEPLADAQRDHHPLLVDQEDARDELVDDLELMLSGSMKPPPTTGRAVRVTRERGHPPVPDSAAARNCRR